MTQEQPVAYVVEDDESFRKALSRILDANDIAVRAFCSAEEFRSLDRDPGPGCILLDVKLPGMSGLELHKRIKEREYCLPVIFLTGHGDIPMCVEAVKSGASDFLPKPVRAEDLLKVVRTAFQTNETARRERRELDALRERYARLTERERQVMALVISGRLNKETASELGITERTIKAHRAQVMSKMEVESLPELVRAAERLAG